MNFARRRRDGRVRADNNNQYGERGAENS